MAIAQTFVNPIIPYLDALQDCVCQELATNGAGPLCWCGMYPGSIVTLEYCEECSNGKCGMGWVRVASANPSTTFPLAVLDPNCRAELAWLVEVGAVRCMGQPEDGELLASDQMLDVAIAQMQDANALYRALLCCDAPSVLVQQWLPIGPDGGCVGGTWTAYIGAT